MADSERDIRVAQLNEIAASLKTAVLQGHASGILQFCGSGYQVDVGVDDFISCDELAKELSGRSGYLYCRYFETACYRTRIEALADKKTSADLPPNVRPAYSTRDILRKAGTALKIEVTFDRAKGLENLDRAVIVFVTPDAASEYGEHSYPYVRLTFWKGAWALSALFPPI